MFLGEKVLLFCACYMHNQLDFEISRQNIMVYFVAQCVYEGLFTQPIVTELPRISVL